MSDDPQLLKLLRQLRRCQARINAELAKGAKADPEKIAAAFAAGRDSPEMRRRTVIHARRKKNGMCSRRRPQVSGDQG